MLVSIQGPQSCKWPIPIFYFFPGTALLNESNPATGNENCFE